MKTSRSARSSCSLKASLPAKPSLTILAAGLALAFGAACSGGVVTSTTGNPGGGGTAPNGGGGQGGGQGGAAPLPPCETDDTTDGYEPFACDLPALCPEAFFLPEQSGGAAGSTPAHYTDVAAAKCVAQKLRDREVGRLELREDPGFNLIPGQFEKRETLFVLDADHAASNWSDAQDLVTYRGTRNRQLLKPSSYFDQCLSAQDDTALHDCLAAWSDGCSDTGASCP